MSNRLRFPAPPFARAPRETGHARGRPSLLLAAFALAAFLFGGLVGFLLGFVAVLLIIDRTWPLTGLLMTDAQHASARLARQRRLAALVRRFKRRPAHRCRSRVSPIVNSSEMRSRMERSRMERSIAAVFAPRPEQPISRCG